MAGVHLAQVNIALPREPPGSALLAEFMAALDPVNAIADAAPGFVWRLQTEDGDATAIRPFADQRLLINLSVWTDLEALRDFVYSGEHVSFMRRRREWFERMGTPILALWWIPVGTLPTVAEAQARLARLEAYGPGPLAFDMRRAFAPDGRPLGVSPAGCTG